MMLHTARPSGLALPASNIVKMASPKEGCLEHQSSHQGGHR
uniref:Uncharacterized protein n=1 Tax=Arundo donax TaxID=35708 RepID=A0A0A9F1F4_ARUDO